MNMCFLKFLNNNYLAVYEMIKEHFGTAVGVELEVAANEYAELKAKEFAEYYDNHIQENYAPHCKIKSIPEPYQQFKEQK